MGNGTYRISNTKKRDPAWEEISNGRRNDFDPSQFFVTQGIAIFALQAAFFSPSSGCKPVLP